MKNPRLAELDLGEEEAGALYCNLAKLPLHLPFQSCPFELRDDYILSARHKDRDTAPS